MNKIKKDKLSLIIPCYNEEENVNALYEMCLKSLLKRDFDLELIFVNDGSTDNTITKLKEFLNTSEVLVKVINFSRNFGKEAAIYAGMKNSCGNFVGIIDADLQQNPELIYQMYITLKENDDYDAACCFQDKRIEGKMVSFLKKVFYKTISKMSKIDFKEGASDFRLFRRYVIDAILSLNEKNRFSKGIFSWIGFKTYYIPYTPEKRTKGKSKFGLKKSLKYAFSGIVSFSVAPLKISTYLGAIISMLSFIFLLGAIIKKIFIGVNVEGYTTLLVCVLFLGGIILLSLGILGEYLARAYMEIKNRPIYIEKENLSNKDDSPL